MPSNAKCIEFENLHKPKCELRIQAAEPQVDEYPLKWHLIYMSNLSTRQKIEKCTKQANELHSQS